MIIGDCPKSQLSSTIIQRRGCYSNPNAKEDYVYP
jgi:hypothetical protein